MDTYSVRCAYRIAFVLGCLVCHTSAGAETAAERTTLVGSETGIARITLPGDCTLRIDPSDIAGSGRFVGFLLTLDPVPTIGSPPSPTFGSVFLAGLAEGSEFFSNMIFRAPDLAAGDYLVYLLADGAPAQVTLVFDGLSGEVDVAMEAPARYQVDLLNPVITTEPARSIYSAGNGGEIFGPGIGFTLLWLRGAEIQGTATGSSGAYGSCLYNLEIGTPPPDPSVAYLPGCPWAPQNPGRGTFQTVQEPGTSGAVQLGVMNFLYEGRWGQGVWYGTASVVDESGGLGFWLTLDAPLSPIPSVRASWGRVKSVFTRP